ncbi:MAG TPA: hypothetical protein VFX96_18875 [Pyrinomonadaceae bacterium]|nr:hypothetical protein [Pyrinomonadaceae bacterium]
MRLVYATGRPRSFEFAVASGPLHLPAGARVLAVCDGPAIDSQLDEQTFGAMSDEEYYTLQALISSLQSAESARPKTTSAPTANTGTLRRFFRRVAGRS